MKKLQITIVLCVLILLGGAAIAQQSTEPTITLNVPLQLTDLNQNVDHIRLICNAYDNVGASHVCAAQDLDVPCPASGNMNQTVAVVMKQMKDCDITKAMSYSATFTIYTKTGLALLPVANDIEARPKEGTTLTIIVRGDVHF
jgi:hypothetical protein